MKDDGAMWGGVYNLWRGDRCGENLDLGASDRNEVGGISKRYIFLMLRQRCVS